MIQRVLLFVFLMTLVGCSPRNEFYVNNLSDRPAQLTITAQNHNFNVVLCVLKTLQTNPTSGAYKNCDATTNAAVSSAAEPIHFELPPHSTTFLGTSGMGYVPFPKIEIVTNGKILVIEGETYKKFFNTKDSFFAGIAHTLTLP